MTTIGIIGAGEVGSQITRAAARKRLPGGHRERESWRSEPGQLAWLRHAWQNRDELARNLASARRLAHG